LKRVKIITDFLLKEKLFKFVIMKAKKKLLGAAALGVKIKRDKSLDKLSGKVLFPEKLKIANKVVNNLKWV
jgi:hypothetical protein